jgi:hypothetical protein
MRLYLLLAMQVVPLFLRAQAPAIDTTLAVQYFHEMRAADSLDRRALWGRTIYGPTLFVDPVSGSIVANAGDRDGVLTREGSLWTGKLPESIPPANTATTLGGTRFTMVMWPLPENRYSRMRLLMHESFHRIQDSLGLPSGNPSNAHMATAGARIWTRLEWRALTEALLREDEARRRAVQDALAIRAMRHKLAASAAEEERQLELNEGLAEYSGFMLSGLPQAVIADRIAVQLGQYEPQESFVRSFAYATGPAYARLLDAANPGWRRKLKSTSSLPMMLADAYRITPTIADSAAVVARYGARRMISDETAREERRIAREAEIHSKFIGGPTLTLSVGNSFSFSFDPNGVTILSGIGSVYQASRITDEWGSLDVTRGGVLMLRNAQGHITGVVVPAPVIAGDSITGDGWKLTPASGWRPQEVETKRGSYTLKR